MRWLSTAVAIAVGLIVLLDYFFAQEILDPLGRAFLDWTIILTAFALLVGLANLFMVHFSRVVRRNEAGTGYSIIVLVTAVIVLVIGLIFPLSDTPMVWLFENVYLPLQGAFFALTAFFLATAAYRAMRIRSIETFLMLAAAIIVLIGQTPALGMMADAKEWILNVPSEAGVRGILLGVALGTLATGLRLLIGLDRPYSE